jgi:CrcB protein
MNTLWWVMLAGGLGSGARYLIGQWAAAAFGLTFPYGTLIINLVACLVLGAVVQVSGAWNPELRSAITIGFLGGFSTYSSFNHETIALLSSGATGAAALYVAITLGGGLAAGALGMWLVRAVH